MGIDGHQLRRPVDLLVGERLSQRVEALHDLRSVDRLDVVAQAEEVVVRPCLLGVETEVHVQVHVHGEAPYGPRMLRPHRAVRRVAVAVEPVAQRAQPLVESPLHEGRREVRDGRRIGAALGDDPLADVAHDVEVGVRDPAHERVRPVERRQRYLLPGPELQAPVRAEVHHRVGLERAPGPQVRRHVGMRRRLQRPVHEAERVVAHPRHRLRENDHVAEPHAGDRDRGVVAVADRHVLPRGGSVRRRHRLPHRRLEVLLGPLRVLGGGHQGRIPPGHVLLERPECVRPEHGPLRLDELPELVLGLGQALDRVAGVAQRAQQVQEARGHLHVAGRHRVLAGALVVVDGHPLVAVGRRLQRQPAFDEVAEGLEPLRHHVEDLVAVLVLELRRDRVGRHAAVQLGQHDAQRQQAAGHALLVGDPLVVVLKDGQGRQHRDVPLPEPRDRLPRTSPREAAVGHQDHEIRLDLLQELEPLAVARHRNDIPFATFEGADDGIDMIAVRVEGAGHAGEQRDGRGARLRQALLGVVGAEGGDRLERQAIVEVKEHVHRPLRGRLHRIRAERLAVELGAGEVQQPGVVLRAPEPEVAADVLELPALQVRDVVLGVRRAANEQARTAPPRFPELLDVRLLQLQAAPVNEHDRVGRRALEGVEGQRLDADRLVSARPLQAGELNAPEVDERDPRRGEVVPVQSAGGSERRQHEDGQQNRPPACLRLAQTEERCRPSCRLHHHPAPRAAPRTDARPPPPSPADSARQTQNGVTDRLTENSRAAVGAPRDSS